MSTPDDAPDGVQPTDGLGTPSSHDPFAFERPTQWTSLDEISSGLPSLDGESADPAPVLQRPTDEAVESFAGPAPEQASDPASGEASDTPEAPNKASDAPTPVPRRRGVHFDSDVVTVRRATRRGMGLLSVIAVVVIVLTGLVSRAMTSLRPEMPDLPDLPERSARPYPPSPLPSDAMPPTVENYNLPQVVGSWTVPVASLRPDLAQPEVLQPANDPEYTASVIDAGDHWIVMTGEGQRTPRDWSAPAPDAKVRLHSLDPDTGREQWSRDLPTGLCATDLLDKRLLCLSATARDPKTGMPTAWTAHLLDPATGKDVATRPVDGGIVRIGIEGRHIILVEQREPAPHLVVHSLSADLRPEWSLDLARQKLHEQWFTENRMVVRRDLSRPDGLALGRVRLRTVGRTTLALWTTGPSAFIDPDKGELLGMRQCSRLVDDGQRLWCNDLNMAQSYDYSLKPLARTPRGIRLGHPERDAFFGDVTVPLFINEEGQAMKVDRRTGKVTGVLVDTSSQSTWGGTLDPSVNQSGTVILIDDADGTVALDASGTRPIWATTNLRSIDRFWLAGETLVVPDSIHLDLLDPATGAVRKRLGVSKVGLHAHPMGERESGVILYAGHTGDIVRVDLDKI